MRFSAEELDLAYRLSAPLMVWPGYEDDITSEIREKAKLARVANPVAGQCSDFECCVYLMTASAVAPFDNTWYKIYAVLFCRAFPEQAASVFGDQTEHLESYEESQLRDFKAWLYKKQIEAVKARLKQAAQVPQAKQAEQVPQAPLVCVASQNLGGTST